MAAVRTRSDTLGASIVAPVFALLWMTNTSFFVYLLFQRHPDEPLVFVSLCGPAIGLILVLFAVVSVARYVRFGSSWLEMDEAPRVGGPLAGHIDAKLTLPSSAEVTFSLTCARVTRVRSSHERRSQSITETLWQESGVVTADAVSRVGARVRIPIRLDVPAGRLPSRREEGRSRIEYRLDARADIPGVDFHVSFPVEVLAPERDDQSPGSGGGGPP